jgi:ElaA protein
MEWILKKFDQLTPAELYAILRLRNEVFVVEQNCVYQDTDNKDQAAFHLMGLEQGALIAYTRLLPPGVSYSEPSIGRVVTAAAARGGGTGRQLMEESLAACTRLFGKQPVRIGAQLYLLVFYESLGFLRSGEVYLEDGIEHIEMIRP